MHTEDWVTPEEYLRLTEPLMQPFRQVIMIHRTRRTVQVATRKYRSRKGHRR